eukprot:PhM_4_TR8443/c1_g1_i4/m.51314
MASMSPSMNRHSTCDHDTYGDDNDGDHQMQHPTECPIRNNNNKPSFRRNKPSAAQPAKIFRKELYKTKMCRAIMSGNTCVYGAECCYAHSPLELRSVEVNVCDGVPDGVGLSKKGSNQRAREAVAQARKRNKKDMHKALLPAMMPMPMPPMPMHLPGGAFPPPGMMPMPGMMMFPPPPPGSVMPLPMHPLAAYLSTTTTHTIPFGGEATSDAATTFSAMTPEDGGSSLHSSDDQVSQEAYDSMVAAMANQFLGDFECET